jgi:hypothetical protein
MPLGKTPYRSMVGPSDPWGVGGVMGYDGAEQDASGGADIATTDLTSLRPQRPMYGVANRKRWSPPVRGCQGHQCQHLRPLSSPAEGRGTRAP